MIKVFKAETDGQESVLMTQNTDGQNQALVQSLGFDLFLTGFKKVRWSY